MPAPSFAGLTALLNQKLGSGGVGNINPNLYSLAQSNPGIFHDVTTGNNIVTVACPRRQPDCGATPVGYNAGVGYDQTTGLGSVDALQAGDGMEWRDASRRRLSSPAHQRHAAKQFEHGGPKRRGVFDGDRRIARMATTPIRVGFVFHRRHFVGIGRVDRIGRHGDGHTGGEWFAVASGHGNDYGNLQRRQQRLGDGQRDGVRIGFSCHAGDR